jgi:tRNA(adenine34) deaminase
MIDIFTPEYFMKEALKEAQNAYAEGEVPVGAVIVSNNTIIARTHNLTEKLTDVTAHAEMMAITSATEALGGKYLNKCHLYVTLEPCVMCGGALAWSQIGEVTFGASDPSRGAGRLSEHIYHPKTIVKGGVLAKECSELITNFFKEKR